MWNSIQTAAQSISYLQDLEEWTKSKVILINNASRAKHKNVKDSGWSYPYIIDIEINWKTHYITWVDDEALVFFTPFIKEWSKVRKIIWLNNNWAWDKNLNWINDLSKETQFRSKEHFPAVQHIIIKILENNPEISEKKINVELNKYLNINNLDFKDPEIKWKIKKKLIFIRNDIIEQLWSTLNWEKNVNKLIHKFILETKKELPKILERWWVLIENWEWEKTEYKKEYLEWFEGIEVIQLIWEIHLFIEKFWIKDLSKLIEKKWLWLDKIKTLFASVWLNFKSFTEEIWFNDLFLKKISKYKESRENLENNELLLIDRDKFWNWIFTYSDKIKNWIDDFSSVNRFSLEDEVEITDINWKVLFSWFLTENIWDKTWENCIWNSSSRWIDWENLLNINKSFWESHSPLKEIQDLEIWSVLNFKEKDYTKLINEWDKKERANWLVDIKFSPWYIS